MSVDWSGLEELRMTVRPITVWPGRATPGHARLHSPFKGNEMVEEGGRRYYRHRKTPFGTTVRDLQRELRALNARDPELQLALRDDDLRRDGFPRANAQLAHPGVVLAFNAQVIRGAPRLRYAVDRFWAWQDNLRAVALGLEALRKVERYGMGQGYEQYAGYRALPEVASQSPEEARQVLRRLSGTTGTRDRLMAAVDPENDRALFRTAAKAAQHDEGEMNAVMNAARTLGVVA